jgi:dihydroorotate dehydrogenase electron transfer subunit
LLQEEFRQRSNSLETTTEDGSFGVKGFVTDILERDILSEKFDMIYACGPNPMLKRVSEIAGKNRVRCQVSLEQRMGCGFGACLICACKTRAVGGGWKYGHVCRDGPVFDSEDVIFE